MNLSCLRVFPPFFLYLWAPLFGLYNGNPAEPNMPEMGVWISSDDWWGIKLGYEWDNTFEKQIKIEDRKSSIRDRFDKYDVVRNEGVITFNVSDRFEFYGKLGAMKLELAQRPTNAVKMIYRTDNQLLWSFGGRIILVYWEEVVMGVNALYSGSFMRINEILQNGAPRKDSTARFKYGEWQVGISFSREIGFSIPYIGLAYASMHSCLYNISHDPNFSFCVQDEEIKNRQHFILLLGIGLTKMKNIALNLESRMIGEKGISLKGIIRF